MSKDRAGGRLDSVIGPETTLKGDIRVGGSLRVDGSIEGQVDVTETLLTGPRSVLRGDVRCAEAVLAGRVDGNVHVAETVEFQSGAQVFGDVTCKGIVIQRDCIFEGRCSMTGRGPAAGPQPGGESEV